MRHEPVLRAFGFDLFHRLTERERLALRKNIGEQHVVMPAERVQRLCKGNEVAGNQARTLVNELIERVLGVGAGLAPIDGPGWAVDMLTFKRDMFPVAFHGQLLKVSGETLQILFVRQHCNGFRSKEIGVPDSEQAKQNGQIALKRSSAEVLVHLMEAAQHGTEILGTDGQHGGKADSGVHRIAPANPVPEAEHIFSVDAKFGNLRGVRGNGDEMFRNRLCIAAETFERPFASRVGVGHGLKGSERFRRNDKERFGRIEIDNGFGKVCAVDVGDETEGHAAFAVMFQRSYAITGPRSEPPIPTLMTLRMRLPVWPVQAPLRTRLEKALILSRTAWTSGTTFFPSTTMVASFGARRATCNTARFSVMLILSPRNIASMRSRSPDSSASSSSNPSVFSVMRFLE